MLPDLILGEQDLTISVVDGIVIIHDHNGSRWNEIVRVYKVDQLLWKLQNRTASAARTNSVGDVFSGPGMSEVGGMGSSMGGGRSGMTGAGLTTGPISKQMSGGLGGMPGGGGDGNGRPAPTNLLDHLIIVVEETIEPNSWATNGGVSSITGLNGLLVVRAPDRTHRQIESLLQQMDETIQ